MRKDTSAKRDDWNQKESQYKIGRSNMYLLSKFTERREIFKGLVNIIENGHYAISHKVGYSHALLKFIIAIISW
jgi:hypothetical protein